MHFFNYHCHKSQICNSPERANIVSLYSEIIHSLDKTLIKPKTEHTSIIHDPLLIHNIKKPLSGRSHMHAHVCMGPPIIITEFDHICILWTNVCNLHACGQTCVTCMQVFTLLTSQLLSIEEMVPRIALEQQIVVYLC